MRGCDHSWVRVLELADGPLFVHEKVTCGGRLSGMVSMILRSGQISTCYDLDRTVPLGRRTHLSHRTFGNCVRSPDPPYSRPYRSSRYLAPDRDPQDNEFESSHRRRRSCRLVVSRSILTLRNEDLPLQLIPPHPSLHLHSSPSGRGYRSSPSDKAPHTASELTLWFERSTIVSVTHKGSSSPVLQIQAGNGTAHRTRYIGQSYHN